MAVARVKVPAARESRHAALRRWERVLGGDFDAELEKWLRRVAARLLIADGDTRAKRRPDAVLKALGLAGRSGRRRATPGRVRPRVSAPAAEVARPPELAKPLPRPTGRTEQLRFWRRIAKPSSAFNPRTRSQLTIVAASVLYADTAPASERAAALLQAVGLTGKLGERGEAISRLIVDTAICRLQLGRLLDRHYEAKNAGASGEAELKEFREGLLTTIRRWGVPREWQRPDLDETPVALRRAAYAELAKQWAELRVKQRQYFVDCAVDALLAHDEQLRERKTPGAKV